MLFAPPAYLTGTGDPGPKGHRGTQKDTGGPSPFGSPCALVGPRVPFWPPCGLLPPPGPPCPLLGGRCSPVGSRSRPAFRFVVTEGAALQGAVAVAVAEGAALQGPQHGALAREAPKEQIS